MPDILFSVIIPVYNRETHIARAIASILAQEDARLEIIVVDDGSTDRTAEVVKAITDARVKYHYQENKERGAARNTGIAHASGDFITFLDSDDEFLPGHLSGAKKFIEQNAAYKVFCTMFRTVYENKTVIHPLPPDIRRKLIRENFLSCNGVFLSAEIVRELKFNEDRTMAGLEDWEYWLRIASRYAMTGTGAVTSQMNHHDGRSVLQTSRESIERRFAAFYRHVYSDPVILSFYHNQMHLLKAGCETYIALHLAMTGTNKGAAIRHLAKGLFYSPSIIFKKRFYAILKRIA